MRTERKKDIKNLINSFDSETCFMSSTHNMYANKSFQKLEKLIIKTENKKRLFKIIKSQLKNNIFLFRLLEEITGTATTLKENEIGKMNKVFDFWNNYTY